MNDMAAIKTDEQKAIEQLAGYDARGVQERELRRIFNCTSVQLSSVRESDYYKETLAVITDQLTAQETSIDDAWNNLEASALTGLQDVMETTADPRVLLSAAVSANKATRRRGAMRNAQGSVIDVDKLVDSTKVVRLRSRFLEQLSQEGNIERMIEREVEIRASSRESLREDMSPKEVRDLLESSLGVDTANLRIKRHQGADQLPGIELDFSKLNP